jgi:hypothetical protein
MKATVRLNRLERAAVPFSFDEALQWVQVAYLEALRSLRPPPSEDRHDPRVRAAWATPAGFLDHFDLVFREQVARSWGRQRGFDRSVVPAMFRDLPNRHFAAVQRDNLPLCSEDQAVGKVGVSL